MRHIKYHRTYIQTFIRYPEILHMQMHVYIHKIIINTVLKNQVIFTSLYSNFDLSPPFNFFTNLVMILNSLFSFKIYCKKVISRFFLIFKLYIFKSSTNHEKYVTINIKLILVPIPPLR